MRGLYFAIAATMAALTAPATAAVTVCSGGGCAAQPNSNVLVNMGETGLTVNGTLNNAPGTVSFTSIESLINNANGQARVGAVDGILNNPLLISYSGGLISAMEFNVNAATSGTLALTFAGGDSDGVTISGLSLGTNGQNFFNIHDGTFTSVLLSFHGDATVEDVRQVRLNVGQAPAVPEPATWAMMLAGFGAIGVMARRRRDRVAVNFA